MPCRYDPSPEELAKMEASKTKPFEDKINLLEAMLCGIISQWVSDSDNVGEIQRILDEKLFFNSEESGVHVRDVAKWYEQHREKDRLRKEAEDEKAKAFLDTLDPQMLEAIKRII